MCAFALLYYGLNICEMFLVVHGPLAVAGGGKVGALQMMCMYLIFNVHVGHVLSSFGEQWLSVLFLRTSHVLMGCRELLQQKLFSTCGP